MRKTIIIPMILFSLLFSNCTSFLDVVPEGISRLENAFTMRKEAEKYLFTCYTYLPKNGNLDADPGLWGGELWTLENSKHNPFGHASFNIFRGRQNARDPLINHWKHYYKALRDCNIFLENVVTVPDLHKGEMTQWIAEVKVLKAYYHFILVRMYGPIVVIRENLPIDATPEEVRVPRDPVDDAFAYIVQLLDEAKDDLPLTILNPIDEMGRITSAIAYSFKAQALVTAASPLYNGNTDQVSLKNKDSDVSLFNQTFSQQKWVDAALACEEAVSICKEAGIRLYEYPGNSQYDLSDTILTQMSLRGAFCERWNDEIIWANSQSYQDLVQWHTTPKLDIEFQNGARIGQELAVPISVAEQFYTANGVPLSEDKDILYNNRYDLQIAEAKDQLYIRRGTKTIKAHFEREPRFYAWIGFDTGIWYGQKHFNDKKPDELFYVQGRKGQLHGATGPNYGPITGYMPKKYVHYKNVQSQGNDNYSVTAYPWPLIRLADLFLLYAEALNESEDSRANRDLAITYIDTVRFRAGLKGVEESWTRHSNNSGKFLTQTGLRAIIQQERKIELAFEGHHFWDIRRWKTAMIEYRNSIQGWDIEQRDPMYYYRKKTIRTQNFGLKDYFWPINNYDITINSNIVQNIGW